MFILAMFLLKTGLFLTALLPAALIVALYYPSPLNHTCTVQWRDQHGNDAGKGPFDACPEKIASRQVGKLQFAAVGGKVYLLRDTVRRYEDDDCAPGEFCLELGRAHSYRLLRFTEMGAPVAIERIESYLDDSYVSDGRTLFYGTLPVAPLTPPFDIAQARALGTPAGGQYVSDGLFVLYGAETVAGADARSFRLVERRNLGGDGEPMTHFARDKAAVYFQGKRVEEADPGSFAVGSYGDDMEPGGDIASDRQHAWQVGFNTLRRLDLSRKQFQQLRKKALVAG